MAGRTWLSVMSTSWDFRAGSRWTHAPSDARTTVGSRVLSLPTLAGRMCRPLRVLAALVNTALVWVFLGTIGSPYTDWLRAAELDAAPATADGVSFTLGETELAYLVSELLLASMREELRLTDAQVKTLEERSSTPNSGGQLTAAEAAQVLTPEQLRRYQQLRLQRTMATGGPPSLLQYRLVVQPLKLTAAQREQLSEVLRKSASESRKLVWGRATLKSPAATEVAAILTPEQQQRWQDLLGEVPLANLFGQLDLPMPYASQEQVLLSLLGVRRLQLTEAQLEPIRQRRRGGSFAALREPSDLSRVFTPEQWLRYRVWGLQDNPETSYVRVTGPIPWLRYRPLVDCLGLAEDQRAKLQVLYRDWINRWWWARSLTGEQLAQSNASFDALLSAEQKTRWQELVGQSPPRRLDDWGHQLMRAELETEEYANLDLLFRKEWVVEDLKLTPAQLTALAGRRVGGMHPAYTDASLAEILSPEQTRRFQQIQLQVSAGLLGPLSILGYRGAVEALSLTPEQRTQLKSAYDAYRQNPSVARDMTPPSAPSGPQQQQQIDTVLTADQRARWTALLGPGRTVPEFGQGAITDQLNELTSSSTVAELKLTPAQVEAVKARQAAGQDAPTTEDAVLRELLTAEQVHGYRQWQLRREMSSQGPLYLFRYRRVVDALALTEEQRTKLKSAYQDFLSRYWLVSRPKQAECRQTVEAILTAEQKTRWEELLGSPASRPRRDFGRTSSPQTPEPTAPNPDGAAADK